MLQRSPRTFEAIVSDPVYLSLWFPDFSGPEMLPHAFAVLQQFPFSAQRPGISYLAVHPISWDEPTVLERRFPSGIDPGQAMLTAEELVHDEYAYVFEAHWCRRDWSCRNRPRRADQQSSDWFVGHSECPRRRSSN